ncbi:succinate dehydrogenase cytochrome b560 subunit, mitochondrial-like isoform X2 [Crassostrea angulata]|uniref:succinate dehydrogenase cytochrome b560 subunit, mitochondrial isoform X2 n=1 Tax=Magallana gigas TaxID=29159 RepID=UPI0022B11B84|nr:succinate dehydrogenase cytochrome b560 subunit, mitochondrial-like isoform X2 [Crassostrea angulata]
MAAMIRASFGKGSALLTNNAALLSRLQPVVVTQLSHTSTRSQTGDIAYKEMEEFWEKNRRLNRPLSPHLRIYNPELTSMLSLCHRATGIAMAVTVPFVAATLLGLPGDFSSYIEYIKDLHLNPAILTAAKYVLAFPICYHYINGIRHLAWDWAIGFDLKTTYQSGYFVMALALLVTAGFVHLL